VPPSKPRADIAWHDTVPSAAQLAARNALWTRLPGHSGPAPEKRKTPGRDPGAITATAGNGRHLMSEHANDSRYDPHST